MTPSSLSVLVLGSLGPNQDRIVALASRVARLVYAYTEFHPNLVALESKIPCVPLARRNLVPQVRYLLARHNITVVYSLLSASDQSTEVTLEILDQAIDIPVVRHYKEHPCFPTMEERRVLMETAGQIYINDESFEYFREAYGVHSWSAHILDADMIAECYMGNDLAPKARLEDGEPHLLVAGGMSMLNDRLDVRELCVEMNKRRVHVHLYGYMVAEELDGRPIVGDPATRRAYERLQSTLPYLHLHEYVTPEKFCSVWSRYDAGFTHAKVRKTDEAARLEEMNLPYRYTAYLAAGLPLVVTREGQRAMKALVDREKIGVVYSDYDELAEKLYDDHAMATLSQEAQSKRKTFSFDRNADKLVSILKEYAVPT